jgi:hypothetical protein
MNASIKAACALGVACALAACASYSPPPFRPGLTLAEVSQKMGLATGRYALPDGLTRVEYARGPMGKHTFMFDVDASGLVLRLDQVMDEWNFNAITAGMTRDEVLLALGRPAARRGAWRDRELWSYRYESRFCQWFVVTLSRVGVVEDTGYVPDPACEDLNHAGFR